MGEIVALTAPLSLKGLSATRGPLRPVAGPHHHQCARDGSGGKQVQEGLLRHVFVAVHRHHRPQSVPERVVPEQPDRVQGNSSPPWVRTRGMVLRQGEKLNGKRKSIIFSRVAYFVCVFKGFVEDFHVSGTCIADIGHCEN